MGCTLSIPDKEIPVTIKSLPSNATAPKAVETSDVKIAEAAPVAPAKSGHNFIDHHDDYGTFKFKGEIAAPYLTAQGLSPNALDDPTWTHKL